MTWTTSAAGSQVGDRGADRRRMQTRRWDGHLHGFLGDPATYSDAEPAPSEIAAVIRSALTTGEA